MHTGQSQLQSQPSSVTGRSPLQNWVVVAADLDVLDSLQGIDAAGFCSAVLLCPRPLAYAQIKHWRPSLVVIAMGFADLEGCQLLTMLAVDSDTRHIPVLVLTTPHAAEEGEVDSERWTPF
jgi:hypothetical protein